MNATATLEPRRFSRYGDELFSKLFDRFPDGRKWRLLIEQALPPDRFQKIRCAAAGYVSACLGSKKVILEDAELIDALLKRRAAMPNITPNGLVVPKREFVLEFNAFHKAVAAAFNDLGLEDLIEAIHIPISLRVAEGRKDEERDARPYATNKMHSDVWAGEPLDAVVVHLPLFGDAENIGVQFAEMQAEKEQEFMRVLKDYSEGSELWDHLKLYDCVMKLGNIYFADARLLHATLRRKPGLRVSIDFRFRMRSEGPYRLVSEEILKAGRQSNYLSYGDFCRIGSDQMIVFDETCEEARRRHTGSGPSTTHYATAHRFVKLFPDRS
jgi:hypothetical protein